MFTRKKELSDKKLGILKARISIFQHSIIWKRKIDFLGLIVDIEIAGTHDHLNQGQKAMVIKALKEIDVLERQVLAVIRNLCSKQGLKFDSWPDYFGFSRIYIDEKALYISLLDRANRLKYELELKGF